MKLKIRWANWHVNYAALSRTRKNIMFWNGSIFEGPVPDIKGKNELNPQLLIAVTINVWHPHMN